MLQLTAFSPITYWDAEAGNRTGKHGLAPGAKANLSGDLRSKALVHGTRHELQSRVHLTLGDQLQIRRLFQLYRKSLLQRVIKDRIASPVVEVG